MSAVTPPPPLPPPLPLQNKLWSYRQHYRKLNRLYISRCVYSAHLDDWSVKILSRHATSLRHQSMEASSILFIQTAAVQYYFCLIVDAWEFMWESYSSIVKFSDGKNQSKLVIKVSATCSAPTVNWWVSLSWDGVCVDNVDKDNTTTKVCAC